MPSQRTGPSESQNHRGRTDRWRQTAAADQARGDARAIWHRAGYAWWRQAEAQLSAGQPTSAAATALRAAAAAAEGHAPLLAQIRTLADRARIPLDTPAATPPTPPQDEVRVPYGLTRRELAVLRLLAAGHSNAQIGAELYISRATAAVLVTNILRKLGVTSRVQAAALAERAGLLDSQQP